MIHGWWCRTRTFPTKCRYCQQEVFFFSCNCGSAVFFDQLGPPWPIHPCHPEDDPYAPEKPNTSFVPLRERLVPVSNPFKGPFPGIEADVVRRATAKVDDHPILRIDPEPKSRRIIVGEVRELTLAANVFKAYRYSDALMGRAMLGKLGAQPVGKITVHAPPAEPGDHVRESYNAWIPSSRIRDSRVARGAAVVAEVEGVPVPDRSPAWFCERIELL